ncbi:hypothetical protein EPUL_003398 [Erysiphe pulchra]|uniref:4a-hydroxytetrahydrobiopterin dehydratase n=1 Tax=Erysiphe pulchra TaxID=225359 RepID=A0A2S4PUC3_9PEZI|nr:hypothetical protein EPUL_003398 [Erysiphe pulchra]
MTSSSSGSRSNKIDNNNDNDDNCSIKNPHYLTRDEEKRTKSRLTIDDLQFSAGYSREQGMKDISMLLRGVEGGVGEGRWTIASDAKGVERTFKFKGFKNAWAFMNIVASESVLKKHHPEWSNLQIYNTVFIRWTTHSPAGLSEKDVMNARFCDQHAKVFGEITAEVNDENNLGADQKLVNNIVDMARDCCIPKKP